MDGGGIRGLSTLMILRYLMAKIDSGLPPSKQKKSYSLTHDRWHKHRRVRHLALASTLRTDVSLLLQNRSEMLGRLKIGCPEMNRLISKKCDISRRIYMHFTKKKTKERMRKVCYAGNYLARDSQN